MVEERGQRTHTWQYVRGKLVVEVPRREVPTHVHVVGKEAGNRDVAVGAKSAAQRCGGLPYNLHKKFQQPVQNLIT